MLLIFHPLGNVTAFKPPFSHSLIRDGPLEKWWREGGGEKTKKKIHARENAKKKKFMQRRR